MFYLYFYLDPRKPGKFCFDDKISFLFEPFYVGKGQGTRAYSHIKEINWKIYRKDKRFITVFKDNLSIRINKEDLDEFTNLGFHYQIWNRPKKNNSKSRIKEQNPIYRKSAVKNRKWITTQNGEVLFLAQEEIEKLNETFTFGRKVDKNKRKRIIEGELKSHYYNEAELNSLPKGTKYQIGLIWKETFLIQ
ncbi:MAG: hypothetical protein N2235_05295 [Fischerella sp.]|nr:hypothetical protein [Fischerella sp.]